MASFLRVGLAAVGASNAASFAQISARDIRDARKRPDRGIGGTIVPRVGRSNGQHSSWRRSLALRVASRIFVAQCRRCNP